MPPIKIYTIPTCAYSRVAKNFFDKSGVSYEEYDLASSLGLRQSLFSAIGEIGTPVIDVDGEIFVGFDPAGLKRTLNLS